MSKNLDSHIEVLPNIPHMTRNKKVDPDVRNVLEGGGSDDDIVSRPHEPTKEELSHTSESSWSWLVIVLATIVVGLTILITWYVLSENSKIKEIPPDVVRPTYIQHPVAMPQYRAGRPRMQHPPPHLPRHPTRVVQHPPSHTTDNNKQRRKAQPKPTTKQPTKEELTKILAQVSQTTQTPPKSDEPTESKEKNTADDKLASAFYQNLQQQAELENDDSDNEEGRVEYAGDTPNGDESEGAAIVEEITK